MRRQRPIPLKLIESWGQKLGFEKDDIDYYKNQSLHTYGRKPAKISKSPTPQYTLIPSDIFAIISDLRHYQILEMMQLKGFKNDLNFLSQQLSISKGETVGYINRLIKAGLLAYDENENLVDISAGFSTHILSETQTSEAHRKHQLQILETAQRALTEMSLEERDQSSLMVATSSKKLGQAKKMITKFRRSLDKFLTETSEKDVVYQLSISLFPLTHPNTKK